MSPGQSFHFLQLSWCCCKSGWRMLAPAGSRWWQEWTVSRWIWSWNSAVMMIIKNAALLSASFSHHYWYYSWKQEIQLRPNICNSLWPVEMRTHIKLSSVPGRGSERMKPLLSRSFLAPLYLAALFSPLLDTLVGIKMQKRTAELWTCWAWWNAIVTEWWSGKTKVYKTSYTKSFLVLF